MVILKNNNALLKKYKAWTITKPTSIVNQGKDLIP